MELENDSYSCPAFTYGVQHNSQQIDQCGSHVFPHTITFGQDLSNFKQFESHLYLHPHQQNRQPQIFSSNQFPTNFQQQIHPALQQNQSHSQYSSKSKNSLSTGDNFSIKSSQQTLLQNKNSQELPIQVNNIFSGSSSIAGVGICTAQIQQQPQLHNTFQQSQQLFDQRQQAQQSINIFQQPQLQEPRQQIQNTLNIFSNNSQLQEPRQQIQQNLNIFQQPQQPIQQSNLNIFQQQQLQEPRQQTLNIFAINNGNNNINLQEPGQQAQQTLNIFANSNNNKNNSGMNQQQTIPFLSGQTNFNAMAQQLFSMPQQNLFDASNQQNIANQININSNHNYEREVEEDDDEEEDEDDGQFNPNEAENNSSEEESSGTSCDDEEPDDLTQGKILVKRIEMINNLFV